MLMNMKELLEPARKYRFAVPAFNMSTSEFFNGVMDECESKNAPVIIEIHPNELNFSTDSFIKMVIDRALRSAIPVAVHLDHGASVEQVICAIQAGFTSVMIDGSLRSFEENIAITKEVVKIAHAVNVSVEAELGTIGATIAGGLASTEGIVYTKPEDVKKFVEATDVDTLAVAIGTAHGLYPKGKRPHLHIDILKEIRKVTDIPLVLHGGSDNPDDEIAEAVKEGIQKINISSDIKTAFFMKARDVLKDESLREPKAVYTPCLEAMKTIVAQKIDLFDDADKVKYYR